MQSGLRPRVAAAYVAAMLITVLSAGCKEKEQALAAGPPDVEITEVTQRNVPVYHEWVAQLNGRTNAQITPRVQGYLLVQNYRNGFFVKKGQLLLEVLTTQQQYFSSELQTTQAWYSELQNYVQLYQALGGGW
jgi:multidrug efflux pump subunit AcrA (membrane-fusion protein)